ncbi:MAG: hypothetical protein CM15mP79_1740 [Methanobacteriota archaeon]|nr:MAG: hypothetical protein CM15mP79_1740 [Euryarchaeota archaeon]
MSPPPPMSNRSGRGSNHRRLNPQQTTSNQNHVWSTSPAGCVRSAGSPAKPRCLDGNSLRKPRNGTAARSRKHSDASVVLDAFIQRQADWSGRHV